MPPKKTKAAVAKVARKVAVKTVKKEERKMSKPAPTTNRRRNQMRYMPKPSAPPQDSFNKRLADYDRRADAGAAAIASTMAAPSSNPPIRFPNQGDLQVGSTPYVDNMKFMVPLVYNAVYEAKQYFAGIMLRPEEKDPVYVITNLSNTGTLVWGSIGNPTSHTGLVNTAQINRTNVVGCRFENITEMMGKGGRMFSIQWQAEASAGVTNFPANIISITGNPKTKVVAAARPPKGDFVAPRQQLSLLDWGFPAVSNSDADSAVQVILFSLPYDTSNWTQAMMCTTYIHGEFGPKTGNAVFYDTRASLVSEDAVARVSEAIGDYGNNTGALPGLVKDVVNTGKEVLGVGKKAWKVAKDVWDFSKPLVSAFSSALGFLDPHMEQLFVSHLLRFQQFVLKMHQAQPDVVTVALYQAACNWPLKDRYKRSHSGRVIEYADNNQVRAIVAHAFDSLGIRDPIIVPKKMMRPLIAPRVNLETLPSQCFNDEVKKEVWVDNSYGFSYAPTEEKDIADITRYSYDAHLNAATPPQLLFWRDDHLIAVTLEAPVQRAFVLPQPEHEEPEVIGWN